MDINLAIELGAKLHKEILSSPCKDKLELENLVAVDNEIYSTSVLPANNLIVPLTNFAQFNNYSHLKRPITSSPVLPSAPAAPKISRVSTSFSMKKENLISIIPSVIPLRLVRNTKTEYLAKTKIQNLDEDPVNIEFWQSGLPGVIHLLPNSCPLKPQEIQKFKMIFLVGENLENSYFELCLLQKLVEPGLVRVYVIVQEENMQLHCDPLVWLPNFTIDVLLKGTVNNHRISGLANTKFSEWREKLAQKVGTNAEWQLHWNGKELNDEDCPLWLGMKDMSYVDALKMKTTKILAS